MATVQTSAVKGKPGRKSNAERAALAAAAQSAPVVASAPVAARPALPPRTPAAPKAAPSPVKLAPKPAPTAAPKPNGNVAPVIAPPPSEPKPNGDIAAMLATIESQKGEIGKQNELIARLTGKEKRIAYVEIMTAPPALREGDWRADWHETAGELRAWRPSKKGDLTEAIPGDASRVYGYYAIPRDSDLGGEGSMARGQGLIAFWTAISEDAAHFTAPPAYFTQTEIVALQPADAEEA